MKLSLYFKRNPPYRGPEGGGLFFQKFSRILIQWSPKFFWPRFWIFGMFSRNVLTVCMFPVEKWVRSKKKTSKNRHFLTKMTQIQVQIVFRMYLIKLSVLVLEMDLGYEKASKWLVLFICWQKTWLCIFPITLRGFKVKNAWFSFFFVFFHRNTDLVSVSTGHETYPKINVNSSFTYMEF